MIILKDLTWSNILSYQNPTSIQLNNNPLTQLIGENGAGKTTIPLVLQEVLYGKNIKNIKKQDLVNRHSNKKGYSINLSFTKDKDEYEVDLDRKSTIKLQLYKNGNNISSHKSLDTYKQIANIIGIPDFKTFSQLVYQSSTGSLEFLTATDTNRKRFLISLLQLEKYLELHELFKAQLRINIGLCSTLEGKIQVIKGQITRNEKEDLTELNKLPVPDSIEQENILKKIANLQNEIDGIQKTNRKIVDNNQYIEDLKKLDFNPTLTVEPVDHERLKEINNKETHLIITISQLEKELKKIKEKPSICPKCGQPIPVVDSTAEKLKLLNKIEECEEHKNILEKEFNKLSAEDKKYTAWQTSKRDWEKLMLLIDEDIPKETLSKAQLEKEIKELTFKYDKLKNHYDAIVEHNEEVAAHNSKVKILKEQLKEDKAKLKIYEDEYAEYQEQSDYLDLLKRIFSTNGLVSYKIESSVKELEYTINEYLSEFSHFQIFFKLDKDKLNIQVIDEAGEETTVEGLSAGELGRVNIATVLAIRKIMASLTSTELNFLFLDEIVGVLDTNGKEKLTEILLNEGLNTFIVAHEFDHPLIPKLHIIKENNISRIENG